MKINNIILHNFGSYEGTTNFETRPCDGRNIVLIGGKNGAGKTGNGCENSNKKRRDKTAHQ